MSEAEIIELSDGRELAYTVYGDENGVPVIFNHGWPGSRLGGVNLAPSAAAAGVRLIAVDRPGMGLSDFQRGRRLLDWPDDVVELIDQLGLEKVHVLGISGGGPYAAACAYKIPERLAGVTIVAGMSPLKYPETTEGMRSMNRFLFRAGRWAPWLLSIMMRAMHFSIQGPDAVETFLSDVPEVDKEILLPLGENLFNGFNESFRQGAQGVTRDGRIYSLPWGFELNEIGMPVDIWQGELDVNVPRSNTKLLETHIPNAKMHMIPGEGHFSLMAHHGEEIFRELIGKKSPHDR